MSGPCTDPQPPQPQPEPQPPEPDIAQLLERAGAALRAVATVVSVSWSALAPVVAELHTTVETFNRQYAEAEQARRAADAQCRQAQALYAEGLHTEDQAPPGQDPL